MRSKCGRKSSKWCKRKPKIKAKDKLLVKFKVKAEAVKKWKPASIKTLHTQLTFQKY